MKINAVLTVDLKNTSSEQRTIFNDSLSKLNWYKLNRLTTLWKASFEEGASEVSALTITKSNVAKAATNAKIIHYDVAVHFGTNPVTEYSV